VLKKMGSSDFIEESSNERVVTARTVRCDFKRRRGGKKQTRIRKKSTQKRELSWLKRTHRKEVDAPQGEGVRKKKVLSRKAAADT